LTANQIVLHSFGIVQL